MNEPVAQKHARLALLPNFIFASRWLQLPIYLGLIAAQAVYAVHFLAGLKHLVSAALGSQADLQLVVASIGYKSPAPLSALNETVIMLALLEMIDVIMISNLIIMVIIGGYTTFVSRLNLDSQPDKPGWMNHVSASVMKVKLATSIIGISSINLLETFINIDSYTDRSVIAQTVLHIVFLLSAMALAYTDKLMSGDTGKRH